ncbi:LuxR family transcriptional regulator [Virgisporangium aliadipatigenens]|uniref:LuxR family transcriptional regulator n=1 Tax=Virgisporangium aliadipatigenens TaxID=741659 RepID=UPI0019407D59|nr:LuxR family transcriptional regulator [Virgisporangium aliadipatigenens]
MRVVVIAAAAGYGKTLAVEQWIRSGAANAARFRFTDPDNAPRIFIRRLAETLDEPGPPESLAPDAALAGLLDRTLIIDDAHLIRPGPVADLLDGIIARAMPGHRLVLVGRSRPVLRLGRLSGAGGLAEFGAAQLAFDHEETAAFLRSVGVPPSEALVEAVLRRTEGWAAGLRLAATAVAEQADPVAVADRFGGHDRHVAEYFRDEVLRDVSPSEVQCLQRCAVLARMSGELCDEVLGVTGSQAWLDTMHRQGLFMSTSDGGDGWYRFHPLFAETLLARLRREEPEREPHLRGRAAGWLEKHRLPENAVAQAIVGRDLHTAARMVSTYGHDLLNTGRVHVVREWLLALRNVVEHHRPLALTAAWTEAFCGNPAGALRALHAAGRTSAAGEPAVPTARLAIVRAAFAVDGVEQMSTDAGFGLDLEPPGGAWYPLAAAFFGIGHLLVGEPRPAVRGLERAVHLGGEQQPAVAALALAELSMLALERDDRFVSDSCVNEAWELVGDAGLQDNVFTVLVHVAAGRLAAVDGDEPAARRHVSAAMRLYASPSPAAFPWLAVQANLGLARILLTLGETPDVDRRLAEARRHLARLSTAGVLDRELAALAAEAESRRSAHAGTARPSGYVGVALTAAELRVLKSLRTHMTLGEIASELQLSRNTIKTQVASVYRKLDATTRTEAVRCGRSLGLLD